MKYLWKNIHKERRWREIGLKSLLKSSGTSGKSCKAVEARDCQRRKTKQVQSRRQLHRKAREGRRSRRKAGDSLTIWRKKEEEAGAEDSPIAREGRGRRQIASDSFTIWRKKEEEAGAEHSPIVREGRGRRRRAGDVTSATEMQLSPRVSGVARRSEDKLPWVKFTHRIVVCTSMSAFSRIYIASISWPITFGPLTSIPLTLVQHPLCQANIISLSASLHVRPQPNLPSAFASHWISIGTLLLHWSHMALHVCPTSVPNAAPLLEAT
ncbi:hypothetical protein AXF42_Ash021090 [Apostasia shenzhenica]|uniref:Uncharacterized protein n=1 Tax=Apostasia shenzhenica TaxID=1088818 RepID=A0A2I0A3F3_9ASPA|nr:hypothetical protein AXF42_Ash021090 [Apostasia shenzhenica]